MSGNVLGADFFIKLKKGDRYTIQNVYDLIYQDLASYINRNSGSRADADDIFQECMYYLFKMAKKDDMPKIDNLQGYITRMYQNQWRVKLKKEKRENEKITQLTSPIVDEEDTYYLAYSRALNRIGDDCKKVLEYYVSGMKVPEMAERLNTTIDYAKRKKYLCKEKLKELAQTELIKL